MSKKVYIKVVNFMNKFYGFCDRMWFNNNIFVVKYNVLFIVGNVRLYLFFLG